MMRKRIAALLAGGAIATSAMFGLAGCGGDNNTITVWGPSAQQESLKEMVNLFLEENPDFGLKIELGVAGEDSAYAQMSIDVKSGADVFAFANDQIVKLYSIGALARLGDPAVEEITANNIEAAVEAGRIGDGYYGYPYAADNGFFMYYDKSVVSEEEAKTLEGVLKACKDSKKYFLYQLTTGWYAGSFIYGAGGEYVANYDGATLESITCNFDEKPAGSDYTYGEIGGQQLIDLKNHVSFVSGGDNEISSYLQGANGVSRFGACISGTWNAGLIEKYLGDNYGATVLPKWTSSLTKEQYDWKSFAGYKLYGVNPYSKHRSEAHKLAAFLSGEAMQMKRFNDSIIGPSNKVVAENPDVKSNLALTVIAKQMAECAVVQLPMPDNYWTEMESFANAMKESGAVSFERVKKLADALREV